MHAFSPHFLSLIGICAREDGKGLQGRGFKWRIDGQWLWSQITSYTCFALHDFLLLFLVTVDNKKCYKTLLTRKQNTDGMLNVKYLGMVIDSGLKSYFVPSQFSWESGKGTAGNAAQVAGCVEGEHWGPMCSVIILSFLEALVGRAISQQYFLGIYYSILRSNW